MKTRFILTIFLSIILSSSAYSAVMEGGVFENDYRKYNQILDKQTHAPIAGAKINIPQMGYTTYTDSNGKFVMPEYMRNNTILSVEKANYRPFSITITDRNNGSPLCLNIEKSNNSDIKIDTNIYHIGDNNYSMDSANAFEFRSKTVGPVYRKSFFMPLSARNKTNYLCIGSIIGIDTALARCMGQNNITTSFASPPSVYFNGKKIAEIKINGDNQKIKIPNELIKANAQNEIKIASGVNMQQKSYTDYDDIEFMNLNIE